jgi:hypothetical protein
MTWIQGKGERKNFVIAHVFRKFCIMSWIVNRLVRISAPPPGVDFLVKK